MAELSNENFIRCHAALQALLSKTIPCLQNAIDLWHHQTTKNQQPCATPNQCPQNRKPSSRNNACQGCIDWANAVEAEVYPSSAIGSLQWRNANPTLFSKDPLEVIKLFVLRIPANKTFSTLEDFDTASLLMIMSKFKEFHDGDPSFVDKVQKVAQVRNSLAHLELGNNLHLDEKTFNAFCSDITALVEGLHLLGRPYFNQQTAQELNKKLTEIKGQSIPARFEREALRQLVEDTVLKTLGDGLAKGIENVDKPSKNTANLEGIIAEVSKDLKRYYLDSLCKKPMYPWQSGSYIDLDDIYVPVTIDIKIPGLRPIKERLTSYHEIFSEGQTATRYVLTGDPGLGKSTFCAKLAFDWSQKSSSPLKHIQLLFIIQLGLIDHKTTIEDAICSQLLSIDVDASHLRKVIRDLGNSVVLVLDGLDEAPPDLFQNQEFGSIVKIIRFDHLRECRVLVATRPWREKEITQFPVYKRLELQKMKKADVLSYVKKFFNQNKTDYPTIEFGRRLLDYIKQNKLLVDTSTPLVVLLICWYWVNSHQEPIPNRIGELYGRIVSIVHSMIPERICDETTALSSRQPSLLNTIRSVLALSRNTLSPKDAIINQLGQVATQGLTPTKTKIVFTSDEIKKSCTDQQILEACAMGIINDRKFKGQNTLQFFHKSGQEFCCSIYLSNHLKALSRYLKDVQCVRDALSIAVVLTFAASCKVAAKLIIGKLLEIFNLEIQPQISQYYRSKLSFDDTRPVQQLIELCLECNFEADAKAEFTSIMKDLFVDGKVLFYGISSKVAISLAYFMGHCDPHTIRDITLVPIAHASDPLVNYGPTGEIYTNGLQNMKSLPDEEIQKIYENFKAANPDLNEDFKHLYGPAVLAAYIQSIQSCEGLPSTSETNLVHIIHSFQHIKLEKLNVNNFRLGSNFDHILDSIKNGHMKSLLVLSARSTALTGHQLTQCVSLLHQLPLLRVLNISRNKAEPGQSIPILAKNISNCTSLQELEVSYMEIPAEDMELLAQNLPSQLTLLAVRGNNMNDAVASRLLGNLPQNLTHLDIDLNNLSRSKHTELLDGLRLTLTSLQVLRIYYSPYVVDLLIQSGVALSHCQDLYWLRLGSTSNEVIAGSCVTKFLDGIQNARNIKKIWLLGIHLNKEGFEKLVEVCREKVIEVLRFDREALPEGVSQEELDNFVILM